MRLVPYTIVESLLPPYVLIIPYEVVVYAWPAAESNLYARLSLPVLSSTIVPHLKLLQFLFCLLIFGSKCSTRGATLLGPLRLDAGNSFIVILLVFLSALSLPPTQCS